MTISSGSSEAWRPELVPYFFGPSPHRLYACHHFPVAESAATRAVVICPATGHEYERSHRCLRQLALQLARAGHHVLRFDYRGTGDSAGELARYGLVDWKQDIHGAIDECLRLSGRKPLCVIGLRLGATLAAQAAAERKDIESLVLYAPIADGKSLFGEWQRDQDEYERKINRARRHGTADELLGFSLTRPMRSALNALAWPASFPALRRALILAEHPGEKAVRRMAQALAGDGRHVSVEPADAPAIWRQEPFEANVPFKLLRRIVVWTQEGA
jgi:alpha-beta hydrolase superfamily lysophospholipase